jgi:type I restriction enzyme S subunit
MKSISTFVKKVVSMDVLLSIKPRFADRIFNGQKKYEFRKTSFRSPEKIDTIYLYASSPVQRIVGAITMDKVDSDAPGNLWNKYSDFSGVADRGQFMSYFEGVSEGHAIKIEKVHELERPINPKDHVENFSPPVSFYYLEDDSELELAGRFPNRITRAQPTELPQYSSD